MNYGDENAGSPRANPPNRTRIPSILNQLSATAKNTRQSDMGPPPKNLKRKINVEAHGDPPRAAPNSQQAHTGAIRSSMGPASYTSSSSKNFAGRHSTATRNSSFGNSLGPDRRGFSKQYDRPQSAMLDTRTQRASSSTYRSNSSLDTHSRPPNGPQGVSNQAWNTADKIEEMEHMHSELRQTIGGATYDATMLKEMMADYRMRNKELDVIITQLTSSNNALHTELDTVKNNLRASAITLEDSKRHHSIELDDLQRQHRLYLEENIRHTEEEIRQLRRGHSDEINALQKRLENDLEDEVHHRRTEMQVLAREKENLMQQTESELNEQRKAVQALENDLQGAREEANKERASNSDLRVKLSEAGSHSITLEVSMRSLRAQIEFLESDNKTQSNSFVDLETRLQNALRTAAEANEKLRIEESLRRKLHNQVQELKGNIRVFCRVRPALQSDSAQDVARITFPDTGADSKEMEILGPDEKSSLGNITTKKNAFAFDRVFSPGTVNGEIFDEISQLVQSALDGYNVCIFCYGQTGSGKTYTMSSEDGMIPRAVHQIYDTAKSLEDKGWKYSMEGSFIEVYNENLNDLLGKAEEFDKKKHEIRHDLPNCKTTITDITIVDLDTPNKVESILRQASANRSVAATKANERSSRSHSVFILKLVGRNQTTGERSEGTLNLVDLAGSERLSHSKATGDRLRETQNINKSLSCLGDVIGALGQGKEGGHVPYRNSKLTYLLQFSLGGNSKTLMFVMISPLQTHLNETLTSLKFATKVHNTHIGTAKKQTKIGNS